MTLAKISELDSLFILGRRVSDVAVFILRGWSGGQKQSIVWPSLEGLLSSCLQG